MANNWEHEFTPVEKQVATDLLKVADSCDWLLYSSCSLMALVMFVLAANRSREGDTVGAILSSVGAVLCATAPMLAKTFSVGV